MPVSSEPISPPAGMAVPAAWKAPVPWTDFALLACAGIFAFHPTTVTWNSNTNYSYGWWIPLVCAFLFWERWPTRPARDGSDLWNRFVPLMFLWGAVFFAFRLATEADPDWRPGLWILATLYIGAWLGWLLLYGGAGWTRHFAFPVCFLVLSLPWFFGVELPLTQGLMHGNAAMAAGSLRLLGIPAIADGNVIDLTTGRLGVEEACSGILSLQSSVMLGCLLGEIYRLGLARRAILLLLTMALALAGNYGRTLFLALLAAFHGIPAVEAWHDSAGFSILVFTGIGSWLLSLLLRDVSATRAAVPAPATLEPEPLLSRSPARTLALTVFAAAALAEAGTQAWFSFREAKIPHHPAWTAQMPNPPSFKAEPVARTAREILFCDASQAGTWQDDHGWNWTLYWFQYNPKPSNKVVLSWHNPDNCLPSVGLKKDADYPLFTANVNGLDFNIQPKRFSTPTQSIFLFWLIYPLSGNLSTVGEYNPYASVTSKFMTHLHDVWNGNRGVGVETLEVAVTGPATYEDAKAAYLACLRGLVQPNPGGKP